MKKKIIQILIVTFVIICIGINAVEINVEAESSEDDEWVYQKSTPKEAKERFFAMFDDDSDYDLYLSDMYYWDRYNHEVDYAGKCCGYRKLITKNDMSFYISSKSQSRFACENGKMSVALQLFAGDYNLSIGILVYENGKEIYSKSLDVESYTNETVVDFTDGYTTTLKYFQGSNNYSNHGEWKEIDYDVKGLSAEKNKIANKLLNEAIHQLIIYFTDYNCDLAESTFKQQLSYNKSGIVDAGRIVMLKNWKLDTSYTGFAEYDGEWYYLVKGVQDVTKCVYDNNDEYKEWVKKAYRIRSGKAYGKEASWFLIDGKIQRDFTGETYEIINGSYWYVQNGEIDTKNNSLEVFGGVFHYINKGKVSTDTGFFKIKYNGKENWYYVHDGYLYPKELQTVGFRQIDNEWWYLEYGYIDKSKDKIVEILSQSGAKLPHYIKEGKLMLDSTGVFKAFYNNSEDWYYIVEGVVDLFGTGICYDSVNKRYLYYRNGKVDFNYSGLIQGTVKGNIGIWHVKKGQVQFIDTVVKESDGNYWYVKNGKIDYSFSGFVKYGSNWFYFANGKADLTKKDVIKGTVDGKTGWWFVNGGKVRFIDSVEQNSNGWWYIKNGMVNTSFTGFAKNNSGWWYCKNGKVDFNKNDVIQGKVNGENGWWYVKGGQVKFVDSVEKNSGGWWCIRKGKVNFNYTGFAKNSSGWWYCEKGKVNFGKKDIIKGTVNGESGYWFVNGGQVKFVDSVEKNSSGWWCIQKGKVNFNYTGFAKNSSGWWYCEKGKVNFGKKDIIKGTVNGESGYWYVNGGQVKFVDSVEKNSSGWWCIQKGKVNFNFTGIASNTSGSWYCKGGQVQFGFTGSIKYNNKTYTIKAGKVVK